MFAINYEVRGIFSIYFTITGTESTFCHTEGFVKLMFYGNLYIRKNEHFLDKKCCNPKIKKKKTGVILHPATNPITATTL